MCLSVPGRIERIANRTATVDVGGVRSQISIDLCPEAAVGNYVLIHAGFAIQLLDEKEAEETLDLLRQVAELS